jgi:hypothetical protein
VRQRVPCAHPVAPQRQRELLRRRAEHEHRHPLAVAQRVVDELVMARVRRQELPED